MVPLGVLLKRELLSERGVRPDILHGQASESKKGEDFTLFKMVANSITTFSLFAIFDGHNGSAAAIYSKENLLNNVLSAIPSDLSRDEWIAALPRALVAGFVKTDKDFQDTAQLSGTTVTFVIIDEYVVTVASVGDSRCILESSEGSVYSLSEDHRLEDNNEEVQRVTACGGEVGRINIFGGAELGPLRCWPGGLCLSRSIGDMDVGEFIVPVPHVKQVKLSSAGGRLIIASDGVWDALSSEMVVSRCHGLPAGAAATKIVKEAIQMKGLRDDTTCIVIDIIKPKRLTPRGQSPPKKPEGRGLYKFLLCKGSFTTSSCPDKECPDAVIIMFEDGSAMLSKRLDIKYPVCNIFKMFICAVCQVEIRPAEAVSIHAAAGSLRPGRVHPWGGPFLCQSCQAKKEAMEGTRLSEDIVASQEELM